MMNRFSLIVLCVPVFGLVAVVPACSSSSSSTVVVPDSGAPGDGGPSADGPADAPAGSVCTKAREDLLIPIDKVSTGMVTVISDTNGTKTLYVDASGGGFQNAVKNPRIYVDLEAGAKVDVTDKTSVTSTAWDLSLKRSVIYTNSGDGGAGQGGAIQLNKSFASVTADEAANAMLEKETFFEEDCTPKLDPTNAPLSTFSDWYEYDQATNQITGPKNVTYVVQGGTGKKYKVGIKTYMGAPDGGTGTASANYVIQVTAL